MKLTSSRLLLATALVAVAGAPAIAQDGGARNVILMVSDGIGFNGWLAVDYYQGAAGQQPYQVPRPDGTAPVVHGLAHDALNLVDAAGRVLPSGTDVAEAAGAVAQGYDPATRWMQFDRTIRNDFAPFEMSYTSYSDSAAAGTSLMTGRKTANGRINMDWTGEVAFRTFGEIAIESGRSVGAVASVQASHATPATVIAHNPSRRDMEGIFNEMLASDITVIMGAGHPMYDASGNAVELAADDTRAFNAVGGPEGTWAALTGDEGLNGFAFIDEREQFEALARGENLPERVVGIARTNSTLQARRENLPEADTPSGMAFNPDVPNLTTMTVAALNVLNQDEDGFFLMSEGGAVDWMGHANDMGRFIEEQIDFNDAVAAVIEWVETNSSWDETLLIVTSDHETGGIWGEGTWVNGTGGWIAADASDEAIEAARFDPAEDTFVEYRAVQDRGAGNMPGFQWSSGNHTNDLVPLWAMGAGAELFAGYVQSDLMAAELWGATYGWDGSFVDNTAVFHVMNEAISLAPSSARIQ